MSKLYCEGHHTSSFPREMIWVGRVASICLELFLTLIIFYKKQIKLRSTYPKPQVTPNVKSINGKQKEKKNPHPNV